MKTKYAVITDEYMHFCPNCGAELVRDGNILKCPNCGTAYIEKEAEHGKKEYRPVDRRDKQ